MLLACDQFEDSIRLAWRTDSGEIELAEATTPEDAFRRMQDLEGQVERIIFPHDEPLRQKLSSIGKPYEQHSRVKAIYQQFQNQFNGTDCVVLSLRRDGCTVGVVKNGHLLSEQNGDNLLGLYALLAEWWKNDSSSLQGFESTFGGQSSAENSRESVLLEFEKALLGKKNRLPLGLPLNLPVAADSKIADWKERMLMFLAQLHPYQEITTLICTDWAATGSLSDLFKEKYQVVLTSDKPFEDAVRGLLLLGQQAGYPQPEPTKVLARDPRHQEYEQQAKKLMTEGKYKEALSYLATLRAEERGNDGHSFLMQLAETLDENQTQLRQRNQEVEEIKSRLTTIQTESEKALANRDERIASLEKETKRNKKLIPFLAICACLFLWGFISTSLRERSIAGSQNELSQQIATLEETIKQRDEKIKNQEQIFVEKDEQIESLTNAVNSQSGELQSLRERASRVSQEQGSALKTEQSKSTALREELNNKNALIATLQQDLQRKSESADSGTELTQRLQQQENEVVRLNKLLKQEEDEKARLEGKNDRLRRQLATVDQRKTPSSPLSPLSEAATLQSNNPRLPANQWYRISQNTWSRYFQNRQWREFQLADCVWVNEVSSQGLFIKKLNRPNSGLFSNNTTEGEFGWIDPTVATLDKSCPEK